jgi:hypothetical protein
MTGASLSNLYRVCVKVYAPEPVGIGSDAAAFVPIFQEWIRDGALDLVMIDVADYAHAPDSPGIMLVTHEAAFALDRSDGQFGLFVQRRIPIEGDAKTALTTTLRQTLQVAAKLERDPRLTGKLKFNAANLRIEANDRLLVPNTEAGFAVFEPVVREVLEDVFRGRMVSVTRVQNDPRDRLALDVTIDAVADLQELMAA